VRFSFHNLLPILFGSILELIVHIIAPSLILWENSLEFLNFNPFIHATQE